MNFDLLLSIFDLIYGVYEIAQEKPMCRISANSHPSGGDGHGTCCDTDFKSDIDTEKTWKKKKKKLRRRIRKKKTKATTKKKEKKKKL
ncbi:hypothetical protein M8J77_002793 [Diaphorina citri]|nr:hypothetical protein M8J77_002793 [Diaphorina citri]